MLYFEVEEARAQILVPFKIIEARGVVKDEEIQKDLMSTMFDYMKENKDKFFEFSEPKRDIEGYVYEIRLLYRPVQGSSINV